MGDEIYSNPIARDKELKGRQLGEMKLAYFRAFLAGFLHTPLLPPPPRYATCQFAFVMLSMFGL